MGYPYNSSYDNPTTVFLHSMKSLIPPSLQPFLLLSYPVPSSNRIHTHAHTSRLLDLHSTTTATPRSRIYYDKGPQDLYFVVFCAIAFTLLREGLIRFGFRPFADNWLRSAAAARARRKGERGSPVGSTQSESTNRNGNGTVKERRAFRESKAERRRRRHTSLRFAEQSWSFTYCIVFWSLGMFVLLRQPSPLSPQQLWGSYPVVLLPALTKFYYLAQLGWWFHQIFVINTEKKRRDHWQMFSHHILTIGLLVGSYWCNFTRIGVVVHVLMDFCDILLPLAKMLRYLSLTTACDATFVIFLVSWLFSRELGLLFVLRTIYLHAPVYMKDNFDPSSEHYYCGTTWWIFVVLLSSLWIMATTWFYMACVVAIRVVRGLGAEDSRSDEEDDDDDEGDEERDSEETEEKALKELDCVPDAHAHPHGVAVAGKGKEDVDGYSTSTGTRSSSSSESELKKRC